jgi:thiol-disulfide isomerase/thioredoxin
MSKFLRLQSLFMLALALPLHAAQINEQAPDCPAILSTTNEALSLKTYTGKVILLDFWATWCPPCKQSMPFLNRMRNELKDKGFEIVAINVDENTEDAQRFLQENPVDYSIAMDPEGKCPGVFDVKAMPSSYFIDKTGKIRAIHLGYRKSDQSSIREQVLNLLAE